MAFLSSFQSYFHLAQGPANLNVKVWRHMSLLITYIRDGNTCSRSLFDIFDDWRTQQTADTAVLWSVPRAELILINAHHKWQSCDHVIVCRLRPLNWPLTFKSVSTSDDHFRILYTYLTLIGKFNMRIRLRYLATFLMVSWVVVTLLYVVPLILSYTREEKVVSTFMLSISMV